MIKLKSCLTCTIVSLLMVFLFSGLAYGVHPWVENPPGKDEDGPGKRVDQATGKKNLPPSAIETYADSRGFSWASVLSVTVYEVSTVLEDIVYGQDASAQNAVTDSRSK